MTTPSSPRLLQVPDRSEYQRRCEEAMKVARHYRDQITTAFGFMDAQAYGQTGLDKVINILKDR